MFATEYRTKTIGPEQAARLVKSGDNVEYGLGSCMPWTIDKALSARKGELSGVTVRGLMAMRPLAVVENDPDQESFRYMSWHFNAYERGLAERGLCEYIPMSYRNQPEIYRKCLTVDVAFVAVAPMDAQGCFSFSLNNTATRSIIESAKLVVLEVNERLPRCLGGFDESVHISEVDYIVEGDALDPIEMPEVPISPTDEAIAGHIVGSMRDGSVIQLGIGSLPNAVGTMIAASDLKDLGMHTEMLTDAFLKIFTSGKLNNKRKNIDRGKGVWSFAFGSRELYDWTHENPLLASCPISYVNAVEIIGKNDNFVSINGCLEADLTGQASSESTPDRHISGTGGQLDFVLGCYLSNGGRSYLCMHSTFTDKKTGTVRSRVLPEIPGGAIVTVPRSQIHNVATEWGVANLAGRSTWERAELMIGIAHPDFRDELIRSAQKKGIWRRSNKIR